MLNRNRILEHIKNLVTHDRASSLDIVALANSVQYKKRLAQKEAMRGGRDMVKLNAEAAALWPKYEKEKSAALANTREIMKNEANQRKELFEE